MLTAKFTKRIQAAARMGLASILEHLSHRPDFNDVHGVAICTIPDATSVYWTAETKAQRDERIQRIHARIPVSSTERQWTQAEILSMFQYEPADWPVVDPAGGPYLLQDLNAALDDYWTRLENSPLLNLLISSDRAVAGVMSALAAGMKSTITEFRQQSAPVPDLLLLAWVNDPDDPEVVRNLARQLNPEALFNEFSKSYYSS